MKRAPTAYRKSMLIVKDMAPSYDAASATQTAMHPAHRSRSFASQSGQHLLLMFILPQDDADCHDKEVEKLGVHAILPAAELLCRLPYRFAMFF